MSEALKVLHTISPDSANFDAPIGELRSTCRMGRKWLDVEIGEEIELTIGPSDTERCYFGKAVVVRIDHLPFDRLNILDHVHTNHSRRSRASHLALFATMQRAYGECFKENTPVTVLFYRLITG
jgi:hypothetical protein